MINRWDLVERRHHVGLSNTFDCLQSLPAREQVALCTAALAESHGPLQAAALRLLVPADRLGRPDLAVDFFGSLLPDAVEVARQWADELLTIARTRIRDGVGKGRLGSFHAVAALSGGNGVETLLQGLEDPMAEVNRVAYEGIEQRARSLASARRIANDGGDPELLRSGYEQPIWAAFERCVKSFPEHQRETTLELLPEFGVKALPLIVQVLKGQRGPAYVEPLIGVLLRSPAPECIDLVLGLAANDALVASMIGKRVLRQRGDEAFQVALAARMVEVAEDNLALCDEVWGTALLEAVPQLDSAVARGLLEPAVSGAANPAQGQLRAEAFLDHPANDVQLAAVEKLRVLRCPNGFERVGRVLRTAADEVRLAAAHLVIELAPPDRAALLTPLLGSKDPEARRLAMQEVSALSLPRFLEKFDSMDPAARAVAARALAKIDGRLAERLVSEFGSISPARRIKALQVVEMLNAGAELRQPLLELLDDDDVRVRATAVRLVQMTGSADGVKVLIDALADNDRRVRANAIEAFEELDDPSYLELLVPFLRDRDNRVRANAAKALWNLGLPDARDVMLAMLKDDDSLMRLSAVWAIQEVQLHGAREILQNRDHVERDPKVRARIRDALAALPTKGQEAR